MRLSDVSYEFDAGGYADVVHGKYFIPTVNTNDKMVTIFVKEKIEKKRIPNEYFHLIFKDEHHNATMWTRSHWQLHGKR